MFLERQMRRKVLLLQNHDAENWPENYKTKIWHLKSTEFEFTYSYNTMSSLHTYADK